MKTRTYIAGMTHFITRPVIIRMMTVGVCCIMFLSLNAQTFSGYGSGVGTNGIPNLTVTTGISPFYVDNIRAKIITSAPACTTITIMPVAGTFANGDLVLIIDVLDCSGTDKNWEFNKIVTVTGTTITLVYNLQRSYNNAQIIQVPEYENVTIDPGAVLTCNAWSNSNGTGGVIPLMVHGTLTVNGTIKAFDMQDEIGTGGTKGEGGSGDAGGAEGEDAVSYIQNINQGGQPLGNAGWGSKFGSASPNAAGSPATNPSIYCGTNGPIAQNLSQMSSKKFLLGAPGKGGKGGDGSRGAGGAGGNADNCNNHNTNPGGTGGDGADGGKGGNGGKGGGIVIIKAFLVNNFGSAGIINASGEAGVYGDPGKQGGNGGEPIPGWGAGGGSGANGGNGGNGGSGGAGGTVYIVASNYSAILSDLNNHLNIAGGSLGGFGIHGNPGAKGDNASLDPGSNCPCPEIHCACATVWNYMVNSQCAPQSTSLTWYSKYSNGTSGTLLSRCFATTWTGGLQVKCEDYATSPPCIYYCDMSQVAGTPPADPGNCLSALCSPQTTVPSTFEQCHLYCGTGSTTTDFKNTCCTESNPDGGRGEPEDGTDGSDGSDGLPGDPGDWGGEPEGLPAPVQVAPWNVTAAICNGSWTGLIAVGVTGGVPPYVYQWSNGETTALIYNLPAGMYSVTVTDINGSSDVGSYLITEPPALNTTSNITNVSCQGLSDGSINLIITGGTVPYFYLWSNGATTQNIAGLAAGTYYVTVTDAHDCYYTTSAIVNSNPQLPVEISIVASANPVMGGTVVTFTALPVNGGPSPTYQWKVNGVNVGLNTPDYSFIPANNDLVTCVLTSSETCVTGNPATSNAVTIQFSNAAPITTAPAVAGYPGTVINIPVTVSAFNSIGAISLTMHYNPAVLTYQSSSVNPGFPGLAVYGSSPGIITAGGFVMEGISLPDQSALFTLTFFYTGGTTGLNWYDTGPSCDYAGYPSYNSLYDVPASTYYIDGLVTELPVVPVQLAVGNQTIGNGQTQCYNATQVITVAGGGTSFLVQPGGTATFIAGYKISFLPGVTIGHGGYLHGYIASAGPFCSSLKITEVINNHSDETSVESTLKPGETFFRIYPNPTTGRFWLELTCTDLIGEGRVEIYGNRGERLWSAELTELKKYNLDLTDQPAGVYFIRVVTEKHAGIGKIIRQH